MRRWQVSSEERFDTRFTLPAVDDSAATETGIILLGLDADRLLAGLGLAALGDDPAQVALVVDYARHGAAVRIPYDDLIAAGARRWHTARPALAAAGTGLPASGSLRRVWTRTLDVLTGLAAADLGAAGPATRAYLTACWLRREDIDRRAADPHLAREGARP
jgi:hypothetical protein